jgi:hypothetical protein
VVTELRVLPQSFDGVSKEAEPVELFVEAAPSLQSFSFRRGEE